MKSLRLIFCLLSSSLLSCCTTTTTYHPDGGKTVVKTLDQGIIVLATKGLDVVAREYRVEPGK